MRLHYLPDDEAYELTIVGRSFYGQSLRRLAGAGLVAVLRAPFRRRPRR